MIDIGTVGSAIGAVKKVYDLVKQIQDAPADIKALQREVSLLDALFDQLKGMSSADRDEQAEDEGKGPRRNEERGAQLHMLLEHAEELNKSADAFLADTTKAADPASDSATTKIKTKMSRLVRRGGRKEEVDDADAPQDDALDGARPSGSASKPKIVSWIWNADRKVKLERDLAVFKASLLAAVAMSTQ